MRAFLYKSLDEMGSCAATSGGGDRDGVSGCDKVVGLSAGGALFEGARLEPFADDVAGAFGVVFDVEDAHFRGFWWVFLLGVEGVEGVDGFWVGFCVV